MASTSGHDAGQHALHSRLHSQTPSSPSRSSQDSTASLRALEMSSGPAGMTTHFGPSGRRGRSNTMTSFGGFEFSRGDLLPLALSEVEKDEGAVMEKTVGFVDGIALLVGSQVGSGIFSSPGVVLANTKSVGASLVIWVVSGILAWTGASSFAELGSMIPLSGGPQAYLAYAYNPLLSFLYSWTTIVALRPASNAIISLIFGEYINRLFYSADVHPDDIPQWAIRLTAAGAVLVVFVLCVASPHTGTRAAVFLTVIKMAALVAVAVLGLIQAVRGKASTSLREPLFSGTSPNPSSFALALYSGLWAYDGWDATNFVMGEMRNAEKNLPRVIHTSMTMVMCLFLCANVSYFVVLDKSTVAQSNTVALDFGRALFGELGGIVFSVAVAISCLGALNGSFFTVSRLVYAAGQEGFLPPVFGRLNQRTRTPMNATALHSSITLVFIAFGGGFRRLVNFCGVASWGFYFLTVLGLLVLRVKEPNLSRPYRTWLITPLVYCTVALFLLFMPVVAAPLEALAALAFVSAGIPIYYISARKTDYVGDETHDRQGSALGAWLGSLFKQRGTRGGYMRAADDDGDERVEMLQRR